MIFIPFGYLFLAGFLQWVTRKFFFPVSQRTIDELESQFPLQGFVYNPSYGLMLMVVGALGFIYQNFF